jgi:hypothetical protein
MVAYLKRHDKKSFYKYVCFSRVDRMKITRTTSSSAGDLIKKMKKENLLIPVAGQGKGKYRFK